MRYEMTDWERKASNTSALSALPLAWMFGYAPASLCLGGIVGGFASSSAVTGVAIGMAIGLAGSLTVALGVFTLGHMCARLARMKHKLRIRRLKSKEQTNTSKSISPKRKWSFKNKFSRRFNKGSFPKTSRFKRLKNSKPSNKNDNPQP